VIESWGKLPDDWTFHEVAAVAVDNKDQVYFFTRGKTSGDRLRQHGNFLRAWGTAFSSGRMARPSDRTRQFF